MLLYYYIYVIFSFKVMKENPAANPGKAMQVTIRILPDPGFLLESGRIRVIQSDPGVYFGSGQILVFQLNNPARYGCFGRIGKDPDPARSGCFYSNPARSGSVFQSDPARSVFFSRIRVLEYCQIQKFQSDPGVLLDSGQIRVFCTDRAVSGPVVQSDLARSWFFSWIMSDMDILDRSWCFGRILQDPDVLVRFSQIRVFWSNPTSSGVFRQGNSARFGYFSSFSNPVTSGCLGQSGKTHVFWSGQEFLVRFGYFR